MLKITWLRAALCALVACSGAAARADDDVKTCSAATLSGTYLFSGSGHTMVGGTWVPKAVLEQKRFNGDGTVVVLAATIADSNGNGSVIQLPPGAVTGTYSIDPGCTGVLSFASGQSFNLVVDPKGDLVGFIQINPFNVLQGTAKRLQK
jgi:hypothetical protein